MTEDTADMMIAYVYDELDDAQRSAFEETLKSDATLRAEVDGLLASRGFLEQDFKNDALLNIEPPAHLLNSILSAEPLAQTRQEVALPTPVKPPFAQRLSTWIFGGGVAISVAAAFVLLNTNVADAELSVQAPATASDIAKPAKTDEAARGESDIVAADGYAGRGGEALKKEAFADKVEGGAVANKDLRGPARLDQKFLGDALKSEPIAEAKSDSKASSGGASPTGLGSARQLEKSKKTDRAKSVKAKRRSAPKPEASLSAKPLEAPQERAFDYGAKGASLSIADKAAPPPPPAAKVVASVADSDNEADDDAVAKAPAQAPMEEVEAAPMDDAPRMQVETTFAPKKAMSSKEMQKRAAQIASRNKKKSTTKRKRSSRVKDSLREESNARNAQQAQASFMAADSEMARGRFLEAYDLYVLAGVQDRKKSMGMAPTWGKMRALKSLKRCKSALKLLPPFERSKVGAKDPAINEGLYIGALCAEETGDIARAKRIYHRLSRDRKIEAATRGKAKAAYERLNARPVKMRSLDSATASEQE